LLTPSKPVPYPVPRVGGQGGYAPGAYNKPQPVADTERSAKIERAAERTNQVARSDRSNEARPSERSDHAAAARAARERDEARAARERYDNVRFRTLEDVPESEDDVEFEEFVERDAPRETEQAAPRRETHASAREARADSVRDSHDESRESRVDDSPRHDRDSARAARRGRLIDLRA